MPGNSPQPSHKPLVLGTLQHWLDRWKEKTSWVGRDGVTLVNSRMNHTGLKQTAIKTALEHKDPTARASVFLTVNVDPKRPLSSQWLTWFNCHLTKFKCEVNFHTLLFRWIRMTMIQFCSYSTWWRNSLRKVLQLLTRYETNSLLPQVSYHPCVDMTFVLYDLNMLLLD